MLKHAFLEIESSDQLLKKGEKKTKAKTMSIMVNLVSFVFKILLKLDRISICIKQWGIDHWNELIPN